MNHTGSNLFLMRKSCTRTLSAFLILICVLLGSGRSVAQEVNVYVSSSQGDRLAEKKPMQFLSAKTTAPKKLTFSLNENKLDQKMIGFGASFLEAGMICINSLDPEQQEAVFRMLFDPAKGAGFTAMKTVIGATDFMSAGPWYSYDDHPGDVNMLHFNVERDLGQNGLIPYIKRAQRYGQFVLQAPMDYPPDWMLFDVEKNQNVNPKYYDALARYYLRYVQEYAKNGIHIDYLSLFNEPEIGYTKIPYDQIRDLLKNHVGPLFRESGLNTQLQMSEDPRRRTARKSYPIILDDPEARKYLTTIPYHGYDFTKFGKRPTRGSGYDYSEFIPIVEFHEMYPDLQLWMSEVCYWNDGTPWAKPLPRHEFEDGDFWGRQIMADIKAGSSGWTYWNMILDQDGGPALVSPIHRNPPNNQQQPLVIIDRKTKKVTYTGAFYYLAHFSKYVRPGSVRIETIGETKDYLADVQSDVQVVAFHRPDGNYVAQLINSRESSVKSGLIWKNKSVTVELPPISITTLVWK